MDRVGLIGLGNVGSGFAKRLREAGYPLTVLDKDERRMEPAIGLGAQGASTPAEVAAASDIVILSLPGSPAVEAVMDGPEGVLGHLGKGQLVVDTGTSRPETDVRYGGLCAEKGAGFIDAPITGRSEGWIMMVGGTEENFERGREVLGCLAYKLKHIGPAGTGQALKLTNQLMQAGQWSVWAEAIEFSRSAGLEPRLLSEYLEFGVPEVMYGDDFSAGGQLGLHYKDLGYILDLAHDTEANIPVTALVHEIFKGAKIAGKPDWFQAGVIAYWRKLNRPGTGV
ncbi:MAG: NAD(P)-dependent oxidoreductase [Armatimonadetes bacterium]|nr:NAD(P)-dependent oxidoreductase [Armatimonadota bacterium]